EIAQVVERRTRAPEVALLLDRCGLGVALSHDQATQDAAILAGYLLPRRIADVIAERNATIGLRLGQEDAPPVVRHPDEAELRPAVAIAADGRREIDLVGLEAFGPHLVPPVEEARLPLLERAQQAAVFAQVDVVRNPLEVIDARHHTLLRSNSLR